MHVECLSGASLISDYERYEQEAGFQDILNRDTGDDLNAYLETDTDGSMVTAG